MLQPRKDLEKTFPKMYALIVYRFRDKRQKHQHRRLSINATTHTFLERSCRELSENVWVIVALIELLTDFEITAKNNNIEGSTLIVATIPTYTVAQNLLPQAIS